MFVIFEEVVSERNDAGEWKRVKRESIVNIDLIQRIIQADEDPGYCLIFLSSGYPILVEGDLMAIYDQLEELARTQHKQLYF